MADIARSDRKLEIVKEARVRVAAGTLKEGSVRDFTVRCDEPSFGGGEDRAPSATEYLTLALGFCLVSQLTRCADMMGIAVRKPDARVELKIEREGSVLAGTVCASVTDVRVHLAFETDERDERRLQQLVRVSEQTCYVLAAIRDAHAPILDVTLNGAPLMIEAIGQA